MPLDRDLVEMPDIDFIVDQISAKYSAKLVHKILVIIRNIQFQSYYRFLNKFTDSMKYRKILGTSK